MGKTLDFEIKLHATQREVFKDSSRFRVVVCGRRWGKSNMILQSIIYETLSFDGETSVLSPQTILVLMPLAVQCRAILFKPLVALIEGSALKYLLAKNGINRSTMTIQFRGKPLIKCAGANDRNGDGCRGTRILFLACDETQDVLPAVWTDVIRPAMSDTVGSRALFSGTPKGTHNILYELAHTPDEEWKFFTYPTSSNPCIPAEEIARAREVLPPRVFRQEYEAAFVSFAGQIYTELSEENIYRESLPVFDLVVMGVDHGAIHPALVVLGRTKEGLWLFLEGWSPNINSTENEPILITRVHENIRRLCGKWKVDSIYADPAQPSEILAIRGLGNQRCYRSAREGFNRIASGINQVHSLIYRNLLQFAAGQADEVEYAVDGLLAYQLMQSYHYLNKKGVVVEEPADGAFSHVCDAVRYALAFKGG